MGVAKLSDGSQNFRKSKGTSTYSSRPIVLIRNQVKRWWSISLLNFS